MGAASANTLFVPETEDEEIQTLNSYVAKWQTVWCTQPAMYFNNMHEVREMAYQVFGIKDPNSLGWIFLSMEKQALQKSTGTDTYFVGEDYVSVQPTEHFTF